MTAVPTWEFRSIPIDFDVFKALTARLESPNDTYNGVLRRELGLETRLESTRRSTSDGKAWTPSGVQLPHGTEFRARYKGALHVARVVDGALVVNDVRYDSPSPAAIAITGGNVNGWRFWECRRPNDTQWRKLDALRDEAMARINGRSD